MEFASDVVSIEKNGGVGTLWLDRPEKYNAMNESFWLAIPGSYRFYSQVA
jgi:enoyl-CoA hydratase